MSAVDPENYEEPADYAIRRQLGLRPILLLADGDGPHPDSRPCPTWCWAGQSSGTYQHEVDLDSPTVARHSMEASPSIFASQYRGEFARGSGRDCSAAVATSTIEPSLEQDGQGDPRIRVALRQPDSCAEVLRLSIEDAKELATVLNFLVDIAEKG